MPIKCSDLRLRQTRKHVLWKTVKDSCGVVHESLPGVSFRFLYRIPLPTFFGEEQHQFRHLLPERTLSGFYAKREESGYTGSLSVGAGWLRGTQVLVRKGVHWTADSLPDAHHPSVYG